MKAELGGTALNNLHFPKPLRYSEDIDLVYHGRPDRAGVDRVREVLNPWFGEPQFVQSEIAPKLKYSVEAEDKSNPAPIRLKIEINTRERTAYDTPQSLPFKVENAWFGLQAPPTYRRFQTKNYSRPSLARCSNAIRGGT
ncbi:nucleotidyl transferase AbiEii/AbiGii toxin family protein [Bradyrhizobium sp. sBnM-33]|uniref:nucleotidyl transferase AbiEii/AbiGii toxin family protein n=1 Tax=Bradyrhizobium sp. sBnM-33 TaxID=2831780 RepID=UPI0028A0A3CA|nr:nucleotidyl transferase AbiEii/AbiGii toxin family protein [Bradyrhizobium sp. sBnM-33]WOH52330.1 nucleotidyl transferase AbiEii/AbiGii toxin family protein [Bradyrhizobium sp. sBnM-33]